jgi:hypothetical protein
MITDVKKAALILDLHNAQKETYVKYVLELIEILINDARVDNDTVPVENFRLNQGEIKGLVRLKEHIVRGLPGVQKVQ